MGDNIKVAVRVRPFNTREKDARCIIQMDGKSTTIINPETDEAKTFAFDYSYWSHSPDNPSFATQQTVFDDLGNLVLENAFQGYNVSLFAYGQTGSGKSYSMVGYGTDKGIIPSACAEMFKRVDAGSGTEGLTYRVETSMMEIYNERVRDLFNPRNEENKSGLKVRENPKTGPYVDGLSSVPVENFGEIEQLMEQGTRARTVAATQMNATSSRAHTIFTIIFTQTKIDKQTMKVTDKVSKVHLVDLAGSERAQSTGASGDRLKEGAAINKSLSALGNCISALADMSSGTKKGKVHIPYRDSVLTWLLKESLGGNARTIMIAALSPADINYEETLSTLRYADRAKQIKNTAVVNEDPNEKLVRELKEEVERLRKLADSANAPTEGLAALTAAARKEAEDKAAQELKAYKEQLAQSQKLIEQMNKSWEQKLKEGQALADSRMEEMRDMGIEVGQEHVNMPQLVNINEDPAKSGAIIYSLKSGKTTVGRPDAAVPQTIKLVGLNVSKEHGVINNVDGKVMVSKVGNSRTWINGEMLGEDPVPLEHNHRVLFGNNYLFRFNDPIQAERIAQQRQTAAAGSNSLEAEPIIDWEFAQTEIAMANGSGLMRQTSQDSNDLKQKMEEFQAMVQKEKEEAQQRLREQEAELKKRDIEMQSMVGQQRETAQKDLEEKQRALLKAQEDLANKLKKQEAEAAALKAEQTRKRRADEILRDRIVSMLPLISEANTISEEMEQEVTFELKIVPRNVISSESSESNEKANESTLAVRVVDNAAKKSRLWSRERFMERVYTIRDMYHKVVMGQVDSDVDQDDNPFSVLDEHLLVGYAHVYLDSLYYLFDIDLTYPIIDYKGKAEGELRVQLAMVGDTNDNELRGPDGSFADNIEPMKGGNAFLKVTIVSAKGLPPSLTDFYVTFKVLENARSSTPVCSIGGGNPKWDSTTYCPVQINPDLEQMLLAQAMPFQVWGIESDAHEDVAKRRASISLDRGGSAKMLLQMDEKAKDLLEREARVLELEQAMSDATATNPKRIVSEILTLEEEMDEADADEMEEEDPDDDEDEPFVPPVPVTNGWGQINLSTEPSMEEIAPSPEPFTPSNVHYQLKPPEEHPSITPRSVEAQLAKQEAEMLKTEVQQVKEEMKHAKEQILKEQEVIAFTQQEKESAQIEAQQLKDEAERARLVQQELEQEATRMREEALKFRLEKEEIATRLRNEERQLEEIRKEKDMAESALDTARKQTEEVENTAKREKQDLQRQLDREREAARKTEEELLKLQKLKAELESEVSLKKSKACCVQ